MSPNEIIDDLLLELSLYHPIPDLSQPEQVRTLIRICEERGQTDLISKLESTLLREKSWRKEKKKAAMAAKKEQDNNPKSDTKKEPTEAEKLGLVWLGGPYYGPKEGQPATHMSKEGKIEPMTDEEKVEKTKRDAEKAGKTPEETPEAPKGEVPTEPKPKTPEEEKRENDLKTAKADPEAVLNDPSASAQSQAIARDQAAKNSVAADEKKAEEAPAEKKPEEPKGEPSAERRAEMEKAASEAGKEIQAASDDLKQAASDPDAALSAEERLRRALQRLSGIIKSSEEILGPRPAAPAEEPAPKKKKKKKAEPSAEAPVETPKDAETKPETPSEPTATTEPTAEPSAETPTETPTEPVTEPSAEPPTTEPTPKTPEPEKTAEPQPIESDTVRKQRERVSSAEKEIRSLEDTKQELEAKPSKTARDRDNLDILNKTIPAKKTALEKERKKLETIQSEEKATEEKKKQIEDKIKSEEPNPEQVITNPDDFKPTEGAPPAGVEVTGEDGKKYYSLGGGYYAESPDGPPVYKSVEEKETLKEYYIRLVNDIIESDKPEDWYRLFEAVPSRPKKKKPTKTIKVGDKSVKVVPVGQSEASQTVAKSAIKSATKYDSIPLDKRMNTKTLNPTELAKYIKSRTQKAEAEFDKSQNKEEFTIGFLKQRSDEVNDDYLRPKGTESSALAENFGVRNVGAFLKGGGSISKEEEEKLIDEMLKTPLAQKIPAGDRRRWAKIALNTARTEANVLSKEGKYKMNPQQRPPFPQGVIMDGQSRTMLVKYFDNLIKEAKTPELKAHYERQLRFIKELDESDTGILYELNDGSVGFKHTSNKSSYADPHNNASVRGVINALKKTLGDKMSPKVVQTLTDTDRKVASAEMGLKETSTRFANETDALSPQEQKRQNRTMSRILENMKVRRGSKNYLDVADKKWFKKKAEQMGISLPPKSNEDIMRVVMGSLKDTPPPSDAVTCVRKMSEYLEGIQKLTDDQLKVEAKRYGVSVADLRTLQQTAGSIAGAAAERRDIMGEAHREIVNAVQEADKGTATPSYPYDKNADNGPHQQAYVNGFLDRMHFSNYIMGDRDGVSSQNIGGDNIEPEYYRQCLSELSGYKGETDTEQGRKGLIDHLNKRLRINPEGTAIVFQNTEGGETIEVGKDEYRTKGKAKGVQGYLGRALQKCLKGKVKIGSNKSVNEMIRVIREMSPDTRKKLLERLRTMKMLLETTSNAAYVNDNEPTAGHVPDGKTRKLNSGKPETWFPQLGFTQLDTPKADKMRAKGIHPTPKDKETQYRKLSYKVQNVVSSALNPAEKGKPVDKWQTVKDPAKQVRKKGEVRYWDLEDTEAGKKAKRKPK